MPSLDADPPSRCFWSVGSAQYAAYHDTEWGFPVADDRRLFEKLTLEGFQSGLSWRTILSKREGFRAAFAGFDAERVARFTSDDVDRLLHDAAIVRHRGKIEAAINNAQRVIEAAEEFGSLAAYVWRFEPDSSERPARVTRAAIEGMAKTPASIALAKDLKRRGWKFVGPTTAYAFMQAMGLVNDHTEDCDTRAAVEAARAAFTPPLSAHHSDGGRGTLRG